MDDRYIVKKKSVMHPEDGFLSAYVGYLTHDAAQELQDQIKKKGLFSTIIIKVES